MILKISEEIFKEKSQLFLFTFDSFYDNRWNSLGSRNNSRRIHETKGDLLIKIQEEREAIKQKLLENQSKMKTLNLNSRILLKEADFILNQQHQHMDFQ